MRLLFYNIPATGHVNPTLPVVAELARRGVEVIYTCTERYRSRIEAAGAECRTYGPVAEDLAPSAGGTAAPFLAMRTLLAAGAGMLPGLIAQARALRPDAVVYDSMTVWGKQVGQALGVPVISSCSIFPICARNFRALPRGSGMFAQMARGAPTFARSALAYQRLARDIRRRYGVPSPAMLDFFANPGDITLVFTSREFTAGADAFDASFKFVGASLAPRGDAGDFPLHLLEGERVLYISLGTLFNKQLQFFRDCIEAFRGSPWRVVMSIGGTVQPADLGELPPNMIVRPHVPQLEVLARASAFITHGGMNSTSEALWHGVPLVAVPQVGDQVFVAQRIAELGAGVALRPERVTPAALRASVDRVTGDAAFGQAASRLGASLRAGGALAAADEVVRFVAAQHPMNPAAEPAPQSANATVLERNSSK